MLPAHIAETLHKVKRRIESIEKMHDDSLEKVFQQTRAVTGILKQMEVNQIIEQLKSKASLDDVIKMLKKL